MTMLETVVQLESWFFLGAIFIIIFYKLVRAEIDLGRSGFHRAQLLVTSIGLAANYLCLVAASRDTTSLPDPGLATTLGLGSSSLLYLAVKLIGAWPALTVTSQTK